MLTDQASSPAVRMSPSTNRKKSDAPLGEQLDIANIFCPALWLQFALAILVIVIENCAWIASFASLHVKRFHRRISPPCRPLLAQDHRLGNLMDFSPVSLDVKCAGLDDRRRCMLEENNYVDADEVPQDIVDEWIGLVAERDRCDNLSLLWNDLANVQKILSSFVETHWPHYHDTLTKHAVLPDDLLHACLAISTCSQNLRHLPPSAFLPPTSQVLEDGNKAKPLRDGEDLIAESCSGIPTTEPNVILKLVTADSHANIDEDLAPTVDANAAVKPPAPQPAATEQDDANADKGDLRSTVAEIGPAADENVCEHFGNEEFYRMPDEMPQLPVATSTPSKKLAERISVPEISVPVAQTTQVVVEEVADVFSLPETIAASKSRTPIETIPFKTSDCGDQPSICPSDASMSVGLGETNSFLTCADSFRDDSVFSNSQYFGSSFVQGTGSAANRFGMARRNQFSQQPLHVMNNVKRMAQNIRFSTNANVNPLTTMQKTFQNQAQIPVATKDDVDASSLDRAQFRPAGVRLFTGASYSDGNYSSKPANSAGLTNEFHYDTSPSATAVEKSETGKLMRTADDSID